MAIQDVWFSNLLDLVKREGGGRKGIRAVADVAGLSEEYVYQLVEKKPNKHGLARSIGKGAATKIARAFAQGRGEDWFDTPGGSAGKNWLLQPDPPIAGAHQVSQEQADYGDIRKCLARFASLIEPLSLGDRTEVLRMMQRLAGEPKEHLKVALSIEGLISASFGSQLRQHG